MQMNALKYNSYVISMDTQLDKGASCLGKKNEKRYCLFFYRNETLFFDPREELSA